jgi:hypothetical protein
VSESSLLEFVSYEPPKSACFGHEAKVKNARKAWALLEAFLDRRTTFSLNQHISFRCVLPYSGPCDVANEFRARANHVLGPGPDGETAEWQITPERFSTALNLAFEEERWSRQTDGPAWLSCSYSFNWKPPLEFAPLNLPHSLSLGVILSAQRLFLQPHFVFPWPWTSERLRTFIRDMEPDVPFRFREQYFKRLIPGKSKGYRVLKLQKGWLSGAQQNAQSTTHPKGRAL